MVKNPWLVLAVILLVLSTLSCTRPDEAYTKTGDRQNENVLRIDIPAPFGSLDPCADATSGSTSIFPLLYSFLFVPNAEGQLEPDLAIRWDYDPQAFTWTIQLRDDALFHDGRRVTARDVEYSLKRFLRDLRPSVFSLIDRITHTSDTSLCISVKEDDPRLPMKIWDIPVVPDGGMNTVDNDIHPTGSGPFKFKYREGERKVALTTFERYYGGPAALDGVLFTYEPDGQKSWARLLAGKTDIVTRLHSKDWQIIKKYHDRFYFEARAHDTYTILLYNTADPLFTDPGVRLALSYAVDRESIIDRIFHGAATVATGPAGVDSPYHNPELKPVPYNPGIALKLLRQAGWICNSDDHFLYRDGKRFEFTILIFEGNQIDRLVAESLQLFLNDIGVKTHLQFLPQNELMRRYGHNNEFQAVLTEFWTPSRLPEIMRQLWATANGQESGAGMFNHPQLNRLLNEAAQPADPVMSKRLYQEADALIASLQPGMFLFQKTYFHVMSKRVRFPLHFSLDHAGTARLRHASLANP
jgi:peptide/nickel transport system substrate-binding protein